MNRKENRKEREKERKKKNRETSQFDWPIGGSIKSNQSKQNQDKNDKGKR